MRARRRIPTQWKIMVPNEEKKGPECSSNLLGRVLLAEA